MPHLAKNEKNNVHFVLLLTVILLTRINDLMFTRFSCFVGNFIH